MANPGQHRGWISKMRLSAENAALMLAVVLALGVVAPQSAQAQTLSVLHKFAGKPDGAGPFAGLVRDAAGNLYGTTVYGGSTGDPGYGVVFKVDSSGAETVLYSFTGAADGAYPYGGLVQDTAGNLYGTTVQGGAYGCSGYGCGTVFKVSTKGKETVLYNFMGGSSDGCYPDAALVRDSAGNLYGTTRSCGASGYGTVFRVSQGGTEAVLHSFVGGASDGAIPLWGGLLMDTKGNLYGVTEAGGGTGCIDAYGCGVVYRLNKNGVLTVLHGFAGGTTDGCTPYGTPALDAKGNLYGTTDACGSFGYGTVWKVNTQGVETVLHNFARGSRNGVAPYAGVVIDAEGNLYGTTSFGGAFDHGALYELGKQGKFTALYSFSGLSRKPIGAVIRDAKGNLYGTAFEGVSSGGTVWKLTP
jgi:uncharacterized repeat protein (TIGR03803 family)